MICECKLYGNQYGAYWRFCEKHGELAEREAKIQGITVEEWFIKVVNDYIDKMERI